METEDSGKLERLRQIEETIAEYEQYHRVPQVNTDVINESQYYVGLSGDDIDGLSRSDCTKGANIVAAAAYHLQKLQNHHRGHANWAHENITHLIAKTMAKVNAPTIEERRVLAIQTSEVAMQLEAMRVKAQMHADRLAFLAQRLEYLSKTLGDIRWEKKREF